MKVGNYQYTILDSQLLMLIYVLFFDVYLKQVPPVSTFSARRTNGKSKVYDGDNKTWTFILSMGEECSTHCYQFHTHLKICLTHLLDNVSHCERTRDLRIQARIRPIQKCADIRIHFYACRKLPYAAYTFTIKNDPFVKRSLYSKPCFVISDHLPGIHTLNQ